MAEIDVALRCLVEYYDPFQVFPRRPDAADQLINQPIRAPATHDPEAHEQR
jgi:hypothetical protein